MMRGLDASLWPGLSRGVQAAASGRLGRPAVNTVEVAVADAPNRGAVRVAVHFDQDAGEGSEATNHAGRPSWLYRRNFFEVRLKAFSPFVTFAF